MEDNATIVSMVVGGLLSQKLHQHWVKVKTQLISATGGIEN
jgi:hypothetical protein